MEGKTLEKAINIINLCESTLSLENKFVFGLYKQCKAAERKYEIVSKRADEFKPELKKTRLQFHKQIEDLNQQVRELKQIQEVKKVIKTSTDLHESIQKEMAKLAKRIIGIRASIGNFGREKQQARKIKEQKQKQAKEKKEKKEQQKSKLKDIEKTRNKRTKKVKQQNLDQSKGNNEENGEGQGAN